MNCPKCDRIVDPQAIKCPYCNNPLKGFGHPGIPLYQAETGTYLCDRCYYHQDDSCNYPQRPYAKSCTMFHDLDTPLVAETPQKRSLGGIGGFKLWCSRNQGFLLIAGLFALSLILVAIV
jgi:Double zinc ribbon